MASAVATMIGGAVMNALAFTGDNFLFSKLDRSNDAEKERERHDLAVERLEAAQTACYNKPLAGYGLLPPRGNFVDHIFLKAQCLPRF